LYGSGFHHSPVPLGWLLACSHLSLGSLDHTAGDLLATGHPHGSWSKQVRAHRRKCPLTSTTDHPQAPGEAAGMPQHRSLAPRALGKNGSDLETSAHHSFSQIQGSRGPRKLFRLYWKRKSKPSSHRPQVAAETIALIREMAKDNRLWGAERIRGELLKLGLRVCKRTMQKYMRGVRTQQPRGQRWSTDLVQPRRTDLGV
jgi:hypothetical protein